MIDENIVFILGAGASKPYGFPLGFDLHAALCSDGTYAGALLEVLEACDIDKGELKRFRKALLASSLPSIDAFLARRNEYQWIGKLAIASQMSRKRISRKPFGPGTQIIGSLGCGTE